MSPTIPFRRHPRFLAKLPRIVRLYIFNCLIGFTLSAVFTAMIFGFNVGNIGHLVSTVSGGWIAAVVFFMLNGIVFSGVQTGIVIMSMDYPGQGKPPKGRKMPVGAAQPVRVKA